MTMDDQHDEDGDGFDAEDWTRLKPFVGAVATLDDSRRAGPFSPWPRRTTRVPSSWTCPNR